jgi:hypothetical protein
MYMRLGTGDDRRAYASGFSANIIKIISKAEV